MGLFDTPEELERRARLKDLEDKRVAFAQKLAAEGFAPERMLFAQTEKGGFTALCTHKGKTWVIVGPDFGSGDDFALESFDRLNYCTEEVLVKSEGMGGIFGFGKKAEIGREYIIARQDGSEAHMPFVCGRSSWLECAANKNPLLKTQRRRGDANLVWDLQPIDRSMVDRVLEVVERYFRD